MKATWESRSLISCFVLLLLALFGFRFSFLLQLSGFDFGIWGI